MIPVRAVNDKLFYTFENKSNSDEVKMVLLRESNKKYEVSAIYNKDLNFYRLKSQCESLSSIHKKGEENVNGVYKRYYFDSTFTYTFEMSTVLNLEMSYRVFVSPRAD